ncbi:MAG: response regulator [Geitlerinemataceae cyanobacterium]
MNSYSSSQKLYPLSWFSEIKKRQYKGCLRVTSAEISWSVYVENGNLIHASNSVDPLDRLDRYLSSNISSYGLIREQWKSQFTSSNCSIPNADYQVICWLVQQNYLRPDRAATIVQEIAKEALVSLLDAREGNYSLNPSETLDNFPKFCALDLIVIARSCQDNLTSSSHVYSQSKESVAAPQRLTSLPPRSVGGSSNTASLLSQEAPPQKAQPSRQPNSNVYTIACIDDNPSIVRVIENYLDSDRFSVLAINDPVKALMQIVRNQPDLILLDVEMPKLDGYELCSMLRRHPRFKKIPIIMVTGNTGFIDRAKAKLVRSSDYLTKPFTKSALNEMVLKHLS